MKFSKELKIKKITVYSLKMTNKRWNHQKIVAVSEGLENSEPLASISGNIKECAYSIENYTSVYWTMLIRLS